MNYFRQSVDGQHWHSSYKIEHVPVADVFDLIPRIQLPMKLLGAAYMLYLAAKPFLPAKKSEAKVLGGSFLIGAVLQLINPKLMI